ncbi:MAG: DUF523 domain-containing protein [Thalassotalea sp.]
MEKILISACFLGDNVRYNAELKPLFHPQIQQWLAENRLIKICPEVTGGLQTPRPAAEFNSQQGKVITTSGVDVTDAFERGAHAALRLCQKYQVKFALLKESSPSCGSQKIYDGSFKQQKIAGEGVTSKLLRQHNIAVYSEENIDKLIKILRDIEENELKQSF